jgi:hypothetical protein
MKDLNKNISQLASKLANCQPSSYDEPVQKTKQSLLCIIIISKEKPIVTAY